MCIRVNRRRLQRTPPSLLFVEGPRSIRGGGPEGHEEEDEEEEEGEEEEERKEEEDKEPTIRNLW